MKITERIDRVTAIPESFRATKLPIPPAVKIELSGRCNLKCWFCATGRNLRKKADMDMGLFGRLVRELKACGVEELGLFYLGESFICKFLEEAVRYAKEIGFSYVFLTTNGTIATKDRVRILIQNGLDSLKFSVNSANKEQFLEETEVNAFDPMVRNIKDAFTVRNEILAETGHKCGLYASSIFYSKKHGKLMEPLLNEIKPFLDEHYWLPLYTQAGLIDNIRGKLPTAGVRGRLGNMRDPLPCWAVFREGHITFDGKLSACCFDHDDRFTMGDLTRETFTEAWNSQAFQDLRQAHLQADVRGTPCENCVAYHGA